MRTITNPVEFRQNVCLKLQGLCPPLSGNNVQNMEKSIYNYCLKDAGERNIVKKWDNPIFVQLYIDRLRSIYVNLKQSDEFRVREILQRVKVISPLVSSYYAIWLWHEIEKGIKENPNNINEVPIQSNKFGGNVVLSNNRLIAVPE